MPRSIIIAPSILASDFGHLADEAHRAEASGSDWLHLDVMDGHFVPNLTIGPDIVKAVRRASKLPLDVHLMVERPDLLAPAFIQAGADNVSIHIENPCNCDLAGTIKAIHAAGKRASLVINPDTPAESLFELLPMVEMVLVMTVVPGFGGQSFIKPVLDKIQRIAARRRDCNLNFDIEVDGGINAETAAECARRGANVMVAGTSLFRAPDMTAAVSAMRANCREALAD